MVKARKIGMIYSQRTAPSCWAAECDILDNPEHWVDAKCVDTLHAAAPRMLAILSALYAAKSKSTQALRLAADRHDDDARALLREIEGAK